MTDPVDVVVVGNGMFGASAARHLAEAGSAVITIGAPASGPDVRTDRTSAVAAHQVYSSHNDAARLTRRQDRNPEWATVSHRAIDRYRAIENRSGINFYNDVGCLISSRPGGDGVSADPLDTMHATGVNHTLYEPADLSWQQTWPDLALPPTHYVAYEPSPAGYVQPKPFIAAQNMLAARAGARSIADTVLAITATSHGHTVTTAGGHDVHATSVLVSAGAFSNFNQLLPSPVDISLKSEVIVLGELSEADAGRLASHPTVKYLVDGDDLEAIYMTPPVRYEDGRHYIKMGANTRLDQWFTTLTEVQRWFNADTDATYLPIYEPALRSLWPHLEFVSLRTQPCIITYTPSRMPLIEQVGDGLFVATAGNGAGAKGADVWGESAAQLVLNAER